MNSHSALRIVGRLLIYLFVLQVVHAQTGVTVAKLIKAEVVQNGGIEVTFSDGHKEVLSKTKTCKRPHVSAQGDAGWSIWNDTNDSGMGHSGETLRVRLRDGTIKDFKPNSRFVMDWNFVDNDSALAIASMGYHGSTFFIKYDLSSGKVLGQVDDYVPYAELPNGLSRYPRKSRKRKPSFSRSQVLGNEGT